MYKYSILFFAICFVACSSSEETVVAEKKESAHNTNRRVKLPVFKDTVINNYVVRYNQYVTDYLADNTAEQLQEEAKALVIAAEQVSERLKTSAVLRKYNAWIATENSKINNQ